MLIFSESGHPVFRAPHAVTRGTLKSEGGGNSVGLVFFWTNEICTVNPEQGKLHLAECGRHHHVGSG